MPPPDDGFIGWTAGRNTFYQTITAAVADITENGFDSQERITMWMDRIRRAAIESMTPEHVLQAALNDTLQTAYRRLVERGGLLRYHPGVSRFTLEKVRPRLRAELDRRIMASAGLIKLNRAAAIEKTLQRFAGWATSIPAGGSDAVEKNPVKTDIRKALVQLPYAERRVAVDQGHKFASNLSEILATDTGAIAGVWHSNWRQSGYNARIDHKHRDLHVYMVRGNWAQDSGLVKAGPDGYTDDITKPGEEVFCLPPDTRIPFADDVEVAYRRWYSGDLTQIVTKSGRTLRATPNHPVLTSDGWVSIGSLKEGQHVIEIVEESLHTTEQHKNDAIPLISQIFGSIERVGLAKMCRGQREQFHGDGTESDIDVVASARKLHFGVISSKLRSLGNLGFSKPSESFSGIGPGDAFSLAGLGVAPSLVSRIRQSLPPLMALSGHTDNIGFGASSDSGSGLYQTLVDARTGDCEAPGNGQNAFSSVIRGERIIDVKRLSYTGHVFNLQTASGWYVAEGIITHNCRCWYQWVYALRALPADMLTVKGRAELQRVKIAA